MAGRKNLLLLTRPGCHLCEEFRQELDAGFPGMFDVQEACVDDRPEWRRYGTKIPVLLTEDGAVLCESVFDAEKVKGLLPI